MTAFEDFVLNLFRVDSTPDLTSKIPFIDILSGSTLWQTLRNNILSIMNSQNANIPFLNKIFSLTEYSNAWASTFGKIFSLSEFNSAWSTVLSKIFELDDLTDWITSNANSVAASVSYSTLETIFHMIRDNITSTISDGINEYLVRLRS